MWALEFIGAICIIGLGYFLIFQIHVGSEKDKSLDDLLCRKLIRHHPAIKKLYDYETRSYGGDANTLFFKNYRQKTQTIINIEKLVKRKIKELPISEIKEAERSADFLANEQCKVHEASMLELKLIKIKYSDGLEKVFHLGEKSNAGFFLDSDRLIHGISTEFQMTKKESKLLIHKLCSMKWPVLKIKKTAGNAENLETYIFIGVDGIEYCIKYEQEAIFKLKNFE